MSPAVKLAGFLVLLALVFAGAHAAGARLGPVTTSDAPERLIAVRSPIARQAVLTRCGGQAVAGGGTLTLTPFGDDAVLTDPVPFENRRQVPLTLVFARAGPVTIEAAVTAPGTP